MKTLQAKLLTMLGAMVLVALGLTIVLARGAMRDRQAATVYGVKNQLAGHLNAAAGWQAIERGVGATILGSEDPPAALLAKFDDLGKKGDAEVHLAQTALDELLSLTDDATLKERAAERKAAHDALSGIRPAVRNRRTDIGTWVPIASANIMSEFAVRDVAFAPTSPQERVRYYNTVVRPNVATLCEYAGRERALLGGTIASRSLIERSKRETLKTYRALVDQASDQIRALKSQSSTSEELREAIEAYEREFFGPYQQLREAVYAASDAAAAAGETTVAYPVDGSTWIKRAPQAINTGLAISNVVGELGTAATAQVQAASRTALIGSSATLVGVLVVFCGITLFVRRSVIGPIVTIMESLNVGAQQVNGASA